MRTALKTSLICLLLAAAVAAQETAAASPYSSFNKGYYARVKGLLIGSAEKMPEENYSFKPVDTVRTWGQLVGHVADAQYLFCSMALGEKNPAPNIEKTKTSKADLIAALKEATAYCDKAYDTMTDASGTQLVKMFGMDVPKLDVLVVNNGHNMEHYGNMVTYLRMKGIVPPSSEQPPQTPPKK